MSDVNKKKTYVVRWQENHVYNYITYVKASSEKEARSLANSSEFDDDRFADFSHVKSIGRKKATAEE